MADNGNADLDAGKTGTEENSDAIVEAIKTILGGVEIFHEERDIFTQKKSPKFDFYASTKEREQFIKEGEK